MTLRTKMSFASFLVALSSSPAVAVLALLSLITINATFLEDYSGGKNIALAFAPSPSPSPVPGTNTVQAGPIVPSPPATTNGTGGERGITSNSNESSSSNKNFLTYENPTYGITMRYPSDWSLTENESIPRTTFFYHDSDSINGKSGLVILTIKEFGGTTLSLQEALDDAIHSKTDNSYYKDLYVVEENTNATLANRPAYLLTSTFSYTFDNTPHQERNIGTIVGDRLYELDYFAPVHSYNTLLPTANSIIDSFSVSQQTSGSSTSPGGRIMVPQISDQSHISNQTLGFEPTNGSSILPQAPDQFNMSSISPPIAYPPSQQ